MWGRAPEHAEGGKCSEGEAKGWSGLSPKEQVWLLRIPDHVFCTLGEVLTSETLIASRSKWPKPRGAAAIKAGKSFGSVLTPSG